MQQSNCGEECVKACNTITGDKTTCKKCKENKPTFVLAQDPTCKSCFLSFIEHTFKMNLRLRCNVTQKNEKILVCISGGQNSCVLTKLISDIVHQTGQINRNKMFIEVEVLHINEKYVWNGYGLECIDNEQIKNFVEKECNFKYHEVNVESLYESDQSPEAFRNLLQNLPDFGSAREDFIWYIKQHLIIRFAKQLGVKRVLLGTNGQRLAASILASLTKGRGMTFTQESEYTHEKQGIFLLKPLRDFLQKSILYYLHIKNISKFIDFSKQQHLMYQVSHQTGNKPARGNINILLQNMIDKLQTGFSSTVTTVLQTSLKVKLKEPPSGLFCPICLMNDEYTMNKLEVQTLDLSTQQDLEQLTKIKFYNLICLSCKRAIMGSGKKIELFELSPEYLPITIRELGQQQLTEV